MAASNQRDTSEQNVQTTRVVLWEHEWPLLRRFSNCLVKIVGEMNETVDQQREKTFSTLEETRESFTKTTIRASQDARTFMKQNPIITTTGIGSVAAIVASARGRSPITMVRFAAMAMFLTSAFIYPDHFARFAVSPSDYWTEEVKPYFMQDTKSQDNDDNDSSSSSSSSNKKNQ